MIRKQAQKALSTHLTFRADGKAPAKLVFAKLTICEIIKVFTCALALVVTGAAAPSFMVVAVLWVSAWMAAVVTWARSSATRGASPFDHLLAYLLASFRLLLWTYVAILLMARFSMTPPIIMRSIG